MAFDEVMLRTQDGKEYGPVTMPQLLEWHRDGRVPPDASLVDLNTKEEQPVSAFPSLILPPPPILGAQVLTAQTAPTGVDHLIPTKNPKALIAYYCGVFSIACGPILGPIAVVLGVMGFRDAKTLKVGRTHALVGIIVGGLITLVSIALIVFSIVGHLGL